MKNYLEFKPVELYDYNLIYPVTSEFGEGSCQHSPVSMFSLREKYGDAFCMEDGVLYVLREKLCTEEYRVYLAPLGGGREAFLNIFEDAHSHGKKVHFHTLTKRYAEMLETEFGGQFSISEERDLAEYMYRTGNMAAFPGHALYKRRQEVNAFWNRFGDRATVKRITKDDMDEIKRFERRWVIQSKENHDAHALERESRMISMQLDFFDELHLSGIVVRIDGEVFGFGYGTKLSDTYYDAIAEKGDRGIPYIYKVLRSESVKQCAMECEFVNMEEDVGIPGLRALKYAYKPEFLLSKYTALER